MAPGFYARYHAGSRTIFAGFGGDFIQLAQWPIGIGGYHHVRQRDYDMRFVLARLRNNSRPFKFLL